MASENELVEFLLDHMSIDRVEVFLDRFATYRVPKRATAITRARNVRVLVACMLRTIRPTTELSEDAMRAVALEFNLSESSVKSIWYSWNRTGRPMLDKGATVDEATAPEAFRW